MFEALAVSALSAAEDEPPPAVNSPSLEDQIAELRARLDGLTAAQGTAPARAGSSPSTVQGSVFGSDAPTDTSGGSSASGGGDSPSTVQGSVFGSDASSTSSWVYDGLTFSSRDGEFRTHLGGAVYLDAIAYGHVSGNLMIPGGAGTQESVDFRRLRIRADGTMYKYIDWVAEFDVAFAL